VIPDETRRGASRPAGLPAVAFAVLALVLALASVASGQATPQIQIGADADVVGVGEMLHLEMSVTSTTAMPSDPRIGATPGLALRGRNQSPSQTHMIMNGVRSDRYTLTVDWTLQAQRVGSFSVGPMSADVGGTRVEAKPVSVRVVPAGQARQPQRRAQQQGPPAPFGFSPFDPWRNLFPGMPGANTAPPAPEPSQPQYAVDPKLSLDAPLGAVYFLHATVDKTSAVVGEQVTFSVLEYRDLASSGIEVDEEDLHDAQVPEFVKHALQREDQEPSLVGFASIGGKTWVVKLVRKWALFPLHGGDLAISPMSVTLARAGSSPGGVRRTEGFRIRVTEPPLAGRPPGYALGDVGRFALAAQVQPRSIEQGGAVGIHVEVSGTGNLPSTIAPGARDGVEWLTPEVHETLGPTSHDAYGGKRSFDFVVRIQKSGDVDLGDLVLPFWDPEQRRYQTARAPLGAVKVTPSAVAASASAAGQRPLAGLPEPRATREGAIVERPHVDDSLYYWLALCASPLLFGLAVAGRAAGRRAVRSVRTRRASPAAELKERMSSADVACRANDTKGADAAIARALEAATLAHVGVSVRAAVGSELVEQLERAGVPPDAASDFAKLLRECEAARFSPERTDAGLSGRDAARARWARAQGVIRSLERGQEKRP
jgi:hypothetical protein